MATYDALIEDCRQEAARAAGGDVVRNSDGVVIFDVDDWDPTEADLAWVKEQITAAIIADARQAAEAFVDEFGEALDPAQTDWDGEAWAMADSSRRAAEDAGLDLWPLYQETLVAETQRLAAEAS